jgi:Mce-associated membrane protein
MAFFALLVILIAVGCVLLAFLLGDARTVKARDEAQQAAADLIPRMLTFDYRTLPNDIANAKSATTGEFAGQYASFVEERVRASAASKELVTQATVRERAVVRGDDDTAVVMLMIDQVSTGKMLTAPRIDNSCVRVTMEKIEGQWRVAGLDRI